MSEVTVPVCKYADKYKAIYTPRCGCERCWKMYFAKHPERLAGFIKAYGKGPLTP